MNRLVYCFLLFGFLLSCESAPKNVVDDLILGQWECRDLIQGRYRVYEFFSDMSCSNILYSNNDNIIEINNGTWNKTGEKSYDVIFFMNIDNMKLRYTYFIKNDYLVSDGGSILKRPVKIENVKDGTMDNPNDTWASEQDSAMNILDSKIIDHKVIHLRKKVNDIMTDFAYSASLYDYPVKGIGNTFGVTVNNLEKIGYPRKGSDDNKIMWECINDFKKRSGAQSGDYFDISISKTVNEDEYGVIRDTYLYFVGRFENEGNIRGTIWRKP